MIGLIVPLRIGGLVLWVISGDERRVAGRSACENAFAQIDVQPMRTPASPDAAARVHRRIRR